MKKAISFMAVSSVFIGASLIGAQGVQAASTTPTTAVFSISNVASPSSAATVGGGPQPQKGSTEN